MTTIENLQGYNSNKFIKENHFFIDGVGTFYESEEIAIKNKARTGNEVGAYIDTLIIQGVKVFRELHTNCWD